MWYDQLTRVALPGPIQISVISIIFPNLLPESNFRIQKRRGDVPKEPTASCQACQVRPVVNPHNPLGNDENNLRWQIAEQHDGLRRWIKTPCQMTCISMMDDRAKVSESRRMGKWGINKDRQTQEW